MEIDYIFARGIFSFKKSARAKILTGWKTALTRTIRCFELGCFSFNSYVYYLTRGFIASTRAFNLATRALLTRGFELVNRGFELVTCEFELVTRRFELVTRIFELLTSRFKLVTCGFELQVRNCH